MIFQCVECWQYIGIYPVFIGVDCVCAGAVDIGWCQLRCRLATSEKGPAGNKDNCRRKHFNIANKLFHCTVEHTHTHNIELKTRYLKPIWKHIDKDTDRQTHTHTCTINWIWKIHFNGAAGCFKFTKSSFSQSQFKAISIELPVLCMNCCVCVYVVPWESDGWAVAKTIQPSSRIKLELAHNKRVLSISPWKFYFRSFHVIIIIIIKHSNPYRVAEAVARPSLCLCRTLGSLSVCVVLEW